jgi:23S rRNA (uracil1939-C5)-methyltransferase
VEFDLSGLRYSISPWGFFQSNWALNVGVSLALAEALGDLTGKRVLDMYAGAGNFSLPLAGGAKEVVAVEENRHSIKDGERNAGLNGFKNFKLVEGRAESAKLKGDFDAALLDPPRPGLTKAAMDRVLGMAPQRVAYVSCNPSTLARDLKKLGDRYGVDSVRLIDFFPNTYHIEALAMLTRL